MQGKLQVVADGLELDENVASLADDVPASVTMFTSEANLCPSTCEQGILLKISKHLCGSLHSFHSAAVFWEDNSMSDQVEMVAAEDAARNEPGGENAVTEQPAGEEPQAPVAAEAAAVTDAPAAQAADAPAAQESAAPAEAEAQVDSESPVAAEAPAEAEAMAEVETPAAVEAPAEAEAMIEVETPAAADAPVEAEASAGDTEQETTGADETDGGKRNVRILAVGQEVTGNVKRIADFGAFVDIGVGRDGLIHISELSVRRVGKVTDVLAEGQEVTAWIKKLDRDRNRISLTLIDPNTKTIRDLNTGDIVQGTVTRILPYGAFIDIGIGRDALLHVREMAQGYVAKPEDVVKPGDTIEARIIELSRRRGRVDLSLKGLRPEPEPTTPAQPEPQAAAQPEPEPEVEDDYADVEVLSPMELAFKRAMEAEGVEFRISKKKQGKRNKRDRDREMQDEIVQRTLQSGRSK
jgi:predicted RNA-binding protein with RPS1 domain